MENYILVWEINDYPENGGGTKTQTFTDLNQVLEKVTKLKKDDINEILFCFKIAEEIKFKAVEKATKWEIE